MDAGARLLREGGLAVAYLNNNLTGGIRVARLVNPTVIQLLGSVATKGIGTKEVGREVEGYSKLQKFKEKGLQNEDKLMIMFEDLRNTGDNLFCASSGVIPFECPLVRPNGSVEASDDHADSDEAELTPPPRAIL
ncbi:hypothetical protein ACP70R_015393 [Stipagrostis hirtigluma subsp. patula]